MIKQITGRKLNVGLVGCGRISTNHFKAIMNFKDDLELKAVCDIDQKSSEDQAKLHNAKGYIDMVEMLEIEQLDIVILCTPSGLHAQQTIIAASHGVHVVTEKPMATRYDDGIQMIQACDAGNVRLFVVKQNRYNATIQILKRAIKEGRFGKINMVHVNVFWARSQSYYDKGNGWRGTWEFDGGAFMNQASHYIDLLSWLVGPVSHVQAMTNTSRNIEVEDTGVVNIKWKNGALGSLAVTMLTYPQNLEGSITILGDKGSVKIGGTAANEIQEWSFSDIRDYDTDVEKISYESGSVYGLGHHAYYKNVIEVMRGIAEPETNGREGLKSLEVICASYLAARDGTVVGLPLKF